MTKRFKAVKASIITGLVLISVLFAVLPTASAGLIFDLQSVLTVEWSANQTQQPVVPRGALRALDLTISHTVTRGVFGQMMLNVYTGKTIIINVEVVETPSWCTATIGQGTLATTVSPGEPTYVKTTLSLQVADDAPAFGLGYIKVIATARKAGLIEGFIQEFTLTFVPDYKPLIQPAYPETNTKKIGPLDTAVFPVQITNLGNARTVVLFTIVDVPSDWNAIVTDQIILEEGEGSSSTAYLVIKPPKNFGYHNDEKTITISMQPVKYDDYSKKGEITYATFLVESRGFSTPGFESIAFIGALAVAFILFTLFRKRK
ncbi:MAG: hypothetical protein WC525_05145 [Candidatus Thermoplasmatota archaeon]